MRAGASDLEFCVQNSVLTQLHQILLRFAKIAIPSWIHGWDQSLHPKHYSTRRQQTNIGPGQRTELDTDVVQTGHRRLDESNALSGC